jgi:hypothetical protein
MDNSDDARRERNRLSAKRSRDRKKASRLGEAVSPASMKHKVGRKVLKDVTKEGDDTREYHRLRYRCRKQKTRVINCSNVRSMERNLRPRARGGDLDVNGLGGGKVFELCDRIESNFSNLREGQETMKGVMDELTSKFTWLMSKDGCWKLFFVRTVLGETSYHPWVEVKKSNVSNGDDGGFCYGLYACRIFKKRDCIGVYVGRVLLGTDEEEVESIYKISVGEGEYHLDIDDKGDGRLTYGVGMHLMNDRHYGEATVGPDENNTMISWDLSVVAQKDIEKGEELTLGYNYNS